MAPPTTSNAPDPPTTRDGTVRVSADVPLEVADGLGQLATREKRSRAAQIAVELERVVADAATAGLVDFTGVRAG